MLICARTCNIFVILTIRSNSGIKKGVDCTFFGIFSELLRGTAKFWGSKNENIAFLSDRLMPIFSFTLKGQFQTFWGIFSSAKMKSPKQVDFGCPRLYTRLGTQLKLWSSWLRIFEYSLIHFISNYILFIHLFNYLEFITQLVHSLFLLTRSWDVSTSITYIHFITDPLLRYISM